jgi:hypothetical protein
MSRGSALLVLVLVLVPASMALASGDTASPPAPAAPSIASFLAGGSQCPRTALPVLLPARQPAVYGICGGCSDLACSGKEIYAACGSKGFNCLLQSACLTSTAPNCKCIDIL